MAILLKGCKPDNFELHNFLKLCFTNIWGFCSNFVECESFLESDSADILALCETNLDDPIDSDNFLVRGYLALIWKDSILLWMVLHFMWKKDFFVWDLSLENSAYSYLCFQLALTSLCLTSFSSIDHLHHCTWFLILFNLT